MLANNLKKFGIETAYSYIEKNPEQNMNKIMDWADRFAGDGPESFPKQRAILRQVINDPDSNWHKLILRALRDTDSGVLKTIFTNFFLNANLIGWKTQAAAREKYQCNVPWAILMDPTSACNLHCTGCWAAEYGNKLNMTLDELDGIVRQGKELGIYLYLYTGGEPLMRKKDIITLCEKHSDCIFLAFTNATLIDDAFAEEMLRVKNFVPAISVEGDREAHDGRRGKGSYDKVIAAMEVLKRHRLPFGISCCYTSQNYNSIVSEAFIDRMTGLGATFAWFFHYMPIGNDAVEALLPNAQQREYVYHTLRAYRKTKDLFTLDFQNDGEYAGGCIAGGRRYLHINANGDVDPCAFVHYSDSNIREKTLLQCLQSPLFMAYHDGQPFNCNHLRPCPMLENPEKLKEMVEKSGAHSTDMQSPEDVNSLCARCSRYADQWTPKADELWSKSHGENK